MRTVSCCGFTLTSPAHPIQAAQGHAEKRLSGAVNPTSYTPYDAFATKLRDRNYFLASVLDGARHLSSRRSSMSWQQLQANHRVQTPSTSRGELAALGTIVDRDRKEVRLDYPGGDP
jgi:hypothetical protein